MGNPAEYKYTPEHEWVAPTAAGIRFGVTDYAQSSLGDIVYLGLPEVGDEVTAGEPCGEVESVKSVSDLFAPVSGTVVAVNADAISNPEIINTDPYGSGWLVEVAAAMPAEGLLDAAGYEALLSDL